MVQKSKITSYAYTVACAVFMSLPVNASPQNDNNEQMEIATDGAASIAAYLIEPVTSRLSPGLFAAIINDQGVGSIASAGVRKQGSAQPVLVNDLIHLGSCTKAMTATMLATLVADGTFKNGWQTTIAEVFPEILSLIHEEYTGVSLWELLDHTSGIAGNAQDWWVYQDMDIIERRYAILNENLMDAPAGIRGEYSYSNLAYMVAGAMAERLTGKSWETLMQERIFNPLGMWSAGFGVPGSVGEVDQPWGHRQEDSSTEWVALQHDNSAALGPAGTVHSSIEDWAKFIQLFFADTTPRILDRRTLDELITPRKGSYAAGWLVGKRNWASGKIYNHNGSNTMWYVTVWIAPELNRAFIAAANSANSDTHMLLDSVISNLINHKVEDDLNTAIALATELVGLPQAASLGASYPNPFNSETTIPYAIGTRAPVTIRLYNISGQLVRELVNQYHEMGQYKASWDGRDLEGVVASSGVYLVRLISGNYNEAKKIMLMK